MNFIDARLKNFVEARLNRDNFCNLVFWLGMTCWVTFSMPENPMLALSSLIGMPYLIRKFFPLKVVEQRPELLLEYPDSSSFAPNSQEKAEKEELPEARECLANSEGKIVSDGAPSLLFVVLSPLVIGFPIAYILDDFMSSIDIVVAGRIGIATFFLIPTAIFELCDRPISLLFDSRAWYLQGWRPMRSSESRYFSYSYRHLSCNRYYHR